MKNARYLILFFLHATSSLFAENKTIDIKNLINYVKKNPRDHEAMFNLANQLTQYGLHDKALDFYTMLLESLPTSVSLLHNMHICHKALGHITPAANCIYRMTELDPEHLQANFLRGTYDVAQGNFAQGMSRFEWRLGNSKKHAQLFEHHRCSPRDLNGKRVIIRREWALGDAMQFIRFAKILKDYGATVIVQTYNTLKPLFSQCDFIDEVVTTGKNIQHYQEQPTRDDSDLPPADLHIPLLSLPSFCSATLTTLPQPPYLHANPELITLWQKRLAHDTQFKVAVCWQTDPGAPAEKNPYSRRSIALEVFEQLATVPGVSFYSIQKLNNVTAEQQKKLYMKLHTFEKDFDDSHGRFMDTAGVMHAVDLVITVDTGLAHLAGAMNRPVWVILPYHCDWRWMQYAPISEEQKRGTPWYPSMKLFKNEQQDSWQDVMQQVTDALKNTVMQG